MWVKDVVASLCAGTFQQTTIGHLVMLVLAATIGILIIRREWRTPAAAVHRTTGERINDMLLHTLAWVIFLGGLALVHALTVKLQLTLLCIPLTLVVEIGETYLTFDWIAHIVEGLKT